MKHISLILLSCLIAFPSHADVRLDADPAPTATGYRFHLGQQSGRYTMTFTAATPSLVLNNLAPGQWFAVITAHNASDACPFWEASDRSDDAQEISFMVSGQAMVDVVVITGTNVNSPRAGWASVVTNRLPKLTGNAVYALRIYDVPSPAPTAYGVIAPQVSKSWLTPFPTPPKP